ncbi:RDD family protein [Lysobacter silvisoli]|uniref:RDD family protein n=1 Tax=Lysobacter silvisoli TaxID=2293254 RepID=A0A371JYD6_9GAMM|nr:RDD family protein [Lysobacter silvisoli]RDZ26691.1 RDD family protein [Lysobacter silvisoli]
MDEHDPYRASSAALTAPLEKLDIESTTKVRRFFNWLIDKAVGYACWAVGAAVAVVILGEPAVQWFEEMSRLLELVLSVVSMLAYYTLMEGAFGFTIGKLITNTRVVDEYGRPPGFGRALLRSLCRFIPFEAFSLLMSEDSVRRGWHDSLARCYVIDRPRNGAPAGRPRHSISDQFADGVLPPARPAAESAP